MNRILLALLLALAAPLAAQQPTHHAKPASHAVKRDSHGRIARSEAEKHRFEVATGHPHGWPGHVVDHVVPLACGGKDDPSNMNWQSTAEGKAKDKWERKGCQITGGKAMGH